MIKLDELLPGIYSWSEYCVEKQIDFNGYYIVHWGESVLIDPPELEPDDMGKLRLLVE